MIGVRVPVENQALRHRERHDDNGSRRMDIDGGAVLVMQLELSVLRHSLAAYALGWPGPAP